MRLAAFLDFQGTLGGEGLDDISSFEFFSFSIEAIKLLNDHGILAIGITNQSHISKGLLTMSDFIAKIDQLKAELKGYGAHLDAVYCCPHTDSDQCQCKKPLTGLIDEAKRDFDIDIENSYVIGDMGMSDMLLARNIHSKSVLVLTGVGRGSLGEYRQTWSGYTPDYIAEHVLDAVNWIIERSSND
jgi:D-glycero-D-manno-heptose 1,7-bisphosphate phosphatase